MKKLLIILNIYFLLITGCLNKNKNNQQNNDSLIEEHPPNIQNTSFTDEELEFMKNNHLSVNDILPYKKYDNFNINYYFIYEKHRQNNNTYLEAINMTLYPNYYKGYEANYNCLFVDSNIMLVNKSFKIDNNYTPNNLVSLEIYPTINYVKRTNETMLLDTETLNYFYKMHLAALNDNIELIIYSGYRTYEKQYHLYYDINKQNDNYSAKPGYSEHHTGKAIDISDSIHGLTLNFSYSKTYMWLMSNSYKYGFILRYPKDKENITKYKYEPWHFRYVGVDIAKKIYEQNITFEEYLLANITF